MQSELTKLLHARGIQITSTRSSNGFSDLQRLDSVVEDADVIAIGLAERFGRPLVELRSKLAKWLIIHHGFRIVALEEDDGVVSSIAKDLGDTAISSRDLVLRLWRGSHNSATVEFVEWTRNWNRDHPADSLTLVGVDSRSGDSSRRDSVSIGLAERTMAAASNGKTVLLGGLAHTAAATNATFSFSPSETKGDNAGAVLRRRLGRIYMSIAITFDQGRGLHEYPSADSSFAESAIAGHGLPALAVVLSDLPDKLRPWASEQTRTRVIGPNYDVDNDLSYHMSGGSMSEWFDIVIHRDRIDPINFLEP